MPTASFTVAITSTSSSTSASTTTPAAAAATTAPATGSVTVRHRNTSRPVTTVVMTHSPQGVHRPPQRVSDPSGRRFLRVGTGRVHGATLDEHPHEDHEQDAEQAHHVPILRHPLGHGLQGLLVEQQVFEPHQGALGIDGTAF